MNKLEEYGVSDPPPPPPSYDLTASGVPVGKVKWGDNNVVYVQEWDSSNNRLFIQDLLDGVKQYINRRGFGIEYVLWDREYDRFEFKVFALGDKDDRPFPRKA